MRNINNFSKNMMLRCMRVNQNGMVEMIRKFKIQTIILLYYYFSV